MINILDCTLRDGGYYNNWDFREDLVREYISSLNESGVNIVEVGYKSIKNSGFYGLFKYCPESQLQFLKDYSNLEYAFMLDVSEFLTAEHKLDISAIDSCVISQKNSVFKWCRVATYHKTIKQAVELIGIVKSKGYNVCCNLMGLSLLSEGQIIEALEAIRDADVKVLYFADSFGSFIGEDIKRTLNLIRGFYDGKIGFHAHDNLEMAFSNTITAINEGIDYIDATITGMGRGSGNLKLEQILLALYLKYNIKKLNPFALLDVIHRYFVPLKAKYNWGWDFSYMLSGLENIHPTYCQNLKSNHQYNISQVVRILTEIPNENRIKFNADVLIKSSDCVLNERSHEESVRIDAYKPETLKEVLIVGTGPSVKRYERALFEFINQYNTHIFECNDTGVLENFRKTNIVLNQVRLSELHKNMVTYNTDEIVTGLENVPKSLYYSNLRFLNCKLKADCFEINNNHLTIPAYVVGMYAIGIALLSKPEVIYLAGFDGSEKSDDKSHQEMQVFWDLLSKSNYLKNTKIISILPTHYDLQECSVFRLLDNKKAKVDIN